jgi:hypothetical protein
MTTNGKRLHRPIWLSLRTNTANAARPRRLFGMSSVSGNVSIFAWFVLTGSQVVDAAIRGTSPRNRAMVEGECQLWCAVIERALLDASQPLVKNKRERCEQIRARDWFLSATSDFKRVCSFAGLEWNRVRSAAIEKIEAVRPNDAPIQYQRVPLQRRRSRGKLYEYEGRLLTVAQLAAKMGISAGALHARLNRGMTIAQAIAMPRNARQGGGVVDNFPESRPDRMPPSTQDSI